MKTLYGIQYLRAFAALAVVVFHAAERTGEHFAIGAAGVDVFFVISGFIMWTTTGRREIGPGEFIRHRLIRIVPLYWIFTLVYLLVTVAGKHNPISTLDVVRSLFFIPWFEEHLSQRISAFYFLGWTLMYEMFFYCVFALTLFLPRSTQLRAVVSCLAILVAAGLLFDFKNGISFAYTSPLLLEFIAGCVIGRLYESKLTPPRSWAAAFICLATTAILWSAWHAPEDLLTRALVWGLPAALIVAAALSFEPDAQKSPSVAGLLLGDASYSIYLSHIIFFLMFNLIAKRTGIVTGIVHGFSEIALFYGTIGTACALAGGLIVYTAIEKPTSKLLARLTKPNAKIEPPLRRASSS